MSGERLGPIDGEDIPEVTGDRPPHLTFIHDFLLSSNLQRGSKFCSTLFFTSTPFFSAQPGRAYGEAVFEPQACLDSCLTNKKTFVYEITKKVVL